RTHGIRDLSYKITIRWDRAGGEAPIVLQQPDQRIDKDWDETFIRGCAPASALDARGSNTPLSMTILVDDQPLKTFTFKIGPGQVTGSSQGDRKDLPGPNAGT